MLNKQSFPFSFEKGRLTFIVLIVIIFVHIFILSKLIFFPYPELFIYPYLTNNGLKPYSQILDQHFPGLMFLPVNFDNLGMNDEKSARLWLFGVVIITHILLYLTSKKILGEKKALLVNLLYLVWQPFFEGWVLWIDNFLPLLLLPGFYFTFKKNFFWSGLFLGMAVVMKQTIIPLVGLIFLYNLWQKDFRSLLRYSIGVLIPVLLMLIFVIKEGYFIHFWYWTVIFNLTIFATSGTQIPSSFGFFSRVAFVYLFSLSAYLYKDKYIKTILALFLVGLLIGAFDRSNFVHFQPLLPFVVIGTVFGFYSQKSFAHSLAKKGAFLILIVLYSMSKTLPAGDIFVFQFPWFLEIAQDRLLAGLIKERVEIIVSDRTVTIDGSSIVNFAPKLDNYIMENYQEIDGVGSTKILKRKASL